MPLARYALSFCSNASNNAGQVITTGAVNRNLSAHKKIPASSGLFLQEMGWAFYCSYGK